MKSLKVFFRILLSTKGMMFIAVLLSFLASFSAISLLGLSAWFLAAAFLVASTSFNFFYPSSAVRGFAIGRTLFKYLHRIVSHNATLKILTILRLQVFASLLRIDSTQRPKLSNNQVINLIVSDVDSLDNFFIQLVLPAITAVLIFIVIAFSLSFIDPVLGISIGLYLLAMLFILPAIFYPLGKRVSRELNNATEVTRNRLLEYFQLQLEYLLFNQLYNKTQEIEKLNHDWMKLQAKRSKQLAIATGTVQILIGILIASTLYYSFVMHDLLHNPDSTTVATVAIASFVILGCIEMLMPIANIFLQLGQIIDSAENLSPMLEDKEVSTIVENVIETYNNDAELQDFDYLYPYPVNIKIKLTTEAVAISVEHLSFGYDNDLILSELNLQVAPRQHIAIYGDTGSGKSTLLNILLGLNTNYQGKIDFDLLNINDQSVATLDAISQQQREFIVSLSQRVHVFNDSLASNLRIANNDASEEQLYSALEKVGLKYLTEQDLGLSMLLGMGGRNLSGGEVRRLGVARVILNSAPVIILDEPTESLDSETERDILNLLWDISDQRTLIMVTHRKTDFNKFDKVYKLQDKRLIQVN